jgi:hypothetical protein
MLVIMSKNGFSQYDLQNQVAGILTMASALLRPRTGDHPRSPSFLVTLKIAYRTLIMQAAGSLELISDLLWRFARGVPLLLAPQLEHAKAWSARWVF